MELIKGNKYEWWYVRTWIYDGILEKLPCDDCRKTRNRLYLFHALDNPDDQLKLGSECVKEMRAAAQH